MPATLKESRGVVLTIGVTCNGDRQEIVIPLATDCTTLSDNDFCTDAVTAAVATLIPLLQACMSADAEIRFLEARGMPMGNIPFRVDIAAGTYPGTLVAGAAPSSVAGMIAYYCEPSDLLTTQRMRVGKQFMPGVPAADIVGDVIAGAIVTNYVAFATAQVVGYNVTTGTGKWYRVISTDTQLADPTLLYRVAQEDVSTRVGTQRRRLLPH